jgi:hypothetical protein
LRTFPSDLVSCALLPSKKRQTPSIKQLVSPYCGAGYSLSFPMVLETSLAYAPAPS